MLPNDEKDRTVRIQLLGDAGVGKTSIILSLVSEEFYDAVYHTGSPTVCEDIFIPPDVTLENTPTVIADFCSVNYTDEEVLACVRTASVLCLVFSCDQVDSKIRIRDYWLPLIRRALPSLISKPVIIVANKCDLAQHPESILRSDFIGDLLKDFSEVESCIECSAKLMRNIPEVFYYAQKSVLYPLYPLFSSKSKAFTDKFLWCLKHIFWILDKDNDGLISKDDLICLQSKCFGVSINDYSLSVIIEEIRSRQHDALVGNKLSLQGFLQLIQLLLENGRNETIWTILRVFFNDDFTFKSANKNVSTAGIIEFTETAFDYLHEVFKRIAINDEIERNNIDKLLLYLKPKPDAEELFRNTRLSSSGNLTFHSFKSWWICQLHMHRIKALTWLAMLGFEYYHSASEAFCLVELPHSARICRSAFVCLVCGQPNVGKTSFLRAFLGKNLHDEAPKDWAVDSVFLFGHRKVLILVDSKDFPLCTFDASNLNPPEFDVVCLFYDYNNEQSLKYAIDFYFKFCKYSGRPSILVGNKRDVFDIQDSFSTCVDDFCRKNNVYGPITLKNYPFEDSVFSTIAAVACFPHYTKFMYTKNFAWFGSIFLGAALFAATFFVFSRVLIRSHRRFS